MEITDAALSEDTKIIKSDSGEFVAIIIGPVSGEYAVDALDNRDAPLVWLDLGAALEAVRELDK